MTPLCGSPSRPCRTVADEVIAANAPSAALVVDRAGRPTVLFRKDDASYAGVVATRSDAGWTTEALPFPVGIVAAQLDPAGTLHALLDTGADTSLQYTARDGSGWQPLSQVLGDAELSSELWAPSAGCLLSGVVERSSVELLQRTAAFSTTTLSADGLSPHSALSASGRPELAWLDATSSSVRVAWQAPPDAVETIAPPANERPDEPLIGVVGTGVGEPHLLYRQGVPGFESDPGTARLVHAVRTGAGTWSTETVVEDVLQPRCFFPTKPAPGTMCTSRNLVHTPVAVLTSDNGDVRLLFLTTDLETVATADANGQVGSTTSTLSQTLDVAASEGGALATTTLADLGSAPGVCAGVCVPAHALVDATGRIHVLVVAGSLRYLAFTP